MVKWLCQVKCIAVVVAPVWRQHVWFTVLLKHLTHVWTAAREDGAFLPVSTQHQSGRGASPWEVFFAICDFRRVSQLEVKVQKFPTIDQCKGLKSFKVGKSSGGHQRAGDCFTVQR